MKEKFLKSYNKKIFELLNNNNDQLIILYEKRKYYIKNKIDIKDIEKNIKIIKDNYDELMTMLIK